MRYVRSPSCRYCSALKLSSSRKQFVRVKGLSLLKHSINRPISLCIRALATCILDLPATTVAHETPGLEHTVATNSKPESTTLFSIVDCQSCTGGTGFMFLGCQYDRPSCSAIALCYQQSAIAGERGKSDRVSWSSESRYLFLCNLFGICGAA